MDQYSWGLGFGNKNSSDLNIPKALSQEPKSRTIFSYSTSNLAIEHEQGNLFYDEN